MDSKKLSLSESIQILIGLHCRPRQFCIYYRGAKAHEESPLGEKLVSPLLYWAGYG